MRQVHFSRIDLNDPPFLFVKKGIDCKYGLSFILIAALFLFSWNSHAQLLIPQITRDKACFKPSRILEFENIPNCRLKYFNHGVFVESQYNDLGFRDIAPPSTAPKKGQKRILLVGASLLVSPSLNFDYIPSSIIRRKLKSKWKNLELFLLATSGHTHVHNLIQLRRTIVRFNPTHIVLYFSNHLVSQDAIYWNIFTLHRNGRPIRIKQISEVIADNFPPLFRARSNQMMNLIELSIFMSYRLRVAIQSLFLPEEQKAELLLKDTVHILKSMNDLSEENGAKFAVTVDNLSLKNTFIVKYGRPVWLAKIFDFFTPEVEVRSKLFLDLLEKSKVKVAPFSINDVPDPSALFFEGDFHYNKLGSETIASKIVDSLISRSFFDE